MSLRMVPVSIQVRPLESVLAMASRKANARRCAVQRCNEALEPLLLGVSR